MTIKNYVTLGVITLILSSTVDNTRADWAFQDEVADKVIETYVSDEKMAKSLWKDESEHPPLPPRKAIGLAKDELKRLSPQLNLKESKLIFEKICLEPHGPEDESWVWVVEFRRIKAAIDYGEIVHVVVLMTGEVVKPSKIRNMEDYEKVRRGYP